MLARIVVSAAACLVAAAALAQEPECATNYKADAAASETFVLTRLAPADVIEMLPRKLNAAGATMQWAEPQKGTLKAGPLDVKAAAAGTATRVTFRASPSADKATLCRYAALVGNAPVAPEADFPQDPAFIAQMKDDLLRKHQILQPDIGRGLNNATFRTLEDFLELRVKGMKQLHETQRQYNVSMLLPRDACGVVTEDIDDATSSFAGRDPGKRTKPVRVDAKLMYTLKDGAWRLGDATIVHLESVK